MTAPSLPQAAVTAALRASHDHDPDRMECHDHDHECCPAGDAHGMFGSDAHRHHIEAALFAALPILRAQWAEEVAGEIDRLTVSEATRTHPYPIDAATAECAAIVRDSAKAGDPS